MKNKEEKRKKRHFDIRKKIKGTPERPRVTVSRSLLHFHAQVIDDSAEKTIVGVSTNMKEFQKLSKTGGNVKAAQLLGEFLGDKLKEKNVDKISFDRSGYQYHGRIKAFADALRSKGIKF